MKNKPLFYSLIFLLGVVVYIALVLVLEHTKKPSAAVQAIDQSLTNIENKVKSISLDSFEIGAMLGYGLHRRGGDKADMDRMIRARREGNFDAIIQLFEEVEARNK